MSDDYDIDSIYSGGGANIKGADLKGYDPIEVTITGWERVEFNDGPKLKISFEETEKTLILNKTNAGRIGEIAGTKDFREWKGHKVTLAHEIVEYNNKMTDGVRVQMPRTGKQAPLTAKKAEPGATEPEELNDKIPF